MPARAILPELRRQIVMNDLQPGTTLTELAEAARHGVSQGAVREALIRLEGEGLVARNGHRGTVVTPLDHDTALEILDLRRRIELRGVSVATAKATQDDHAKLRALIHRMQRNAEAHDPWALIESDTEFHLALFRLSGLLALEPILARCILHTHRFRLWAPWHRRPLHLTASRHQPILTALEHADAGALTKALANHLDTIVEAPMTQQGNVA